MNARFITIFLLALGCALSWVGPAVAQPQDDDGVNDPPEVDDPDAEDTPVPDDPDAVNPGGEDTGGEDAGGGEDAAVADPPRPGLQPSAPVKTDGPETNCTDRIDNDGDSVVDCADADCYEKPECRPTGVREQTDQLCSDWIDNDGDGTMDCDDLDCQGNTVSVCQGFYTGQPSQTANQVRGGKHFNLPELDEGVSVDEIIGKFGDEDGERNDYTCSDGVDNDGDGRTDCADFGCRFDSQVTVCNPQPGMRFSVVGQIEQSYRIEDTNAQALDQNDWDTQFSVLQLRALGPIANLENSFFLLSMRAEKTPRLTFALFQLPIGNMGHYFNINSGGAGLTSQLVVSQAKQLMLQRPFYVYNAFEQGNGAAAEVGGPIDAGGRVNFRVFGAGGSGRFAGNVGGRFFADDNTNYTWAAGGQFHFNIMGYYSRFDSPYLFNPQPLTIAVLAGAKYDQRAQERYPAWNGTGVVRWWHFHLMGETYWKRELEFGSWQYSYYVQLGALLWPRHLEIAGDFGEYIAGDIDNLPDNLESDIGREISQQRDERQARAILHWYAYEQTGLISLRYTYRDVKNGRFAEDGFREQMLSLIATYRF